MTEQTRKVGAFEIGIEQKSEFLFEVRLDRPDSVIQIDEPPPLGKNQAPNPARLLAAAIGGCVSASLVFCLKRHKGVTLEGLRTRVQVELVRNEDKRQRIGKVHVTLEPPPGVDEAALAECREVFEDFCTVTQSVRRGIDVEVDLVSAEDARVA
jgi:uncharacterized OsmC-like protein